MFDMDVLRNLELIEEREIYENNFISIEDIIKSDEMDYYTCPQFEDRFFKTYEFEEFEVEKLDLEFDFEDYCLQLRDEQLIEQRLAYEQAYLFQIEDNDLFDYQIESYYKEDYSYFDFDYEYDYYDCFGGYDIEEHDYMEASYCGNQFLDYIPNDDLFDRLDGCDYPEGPEENLNGLKLYDEFFNIPHESLNYLEPPIDYPDDFCCCGEPKYPIEELAADLYESEESHMQNLIDQHIEEERKFLEFISDGEILEGYYPPEALDGNIILLN